MFWSKNFKIKDQIIVAICDKELLGRKISIEDFSIKINRIFYGGELIDEKKALQLMGKSTVGNLFGKKIVELAIKNNFIAEENIIYFDDIPHAQFLQ